MKLFLALAVLCVFGAVMVEGPDSYTKQTFLAHLKVCREEVRADDDNVHELMQYSTNYSMKAKCLFACIIKKTKLMDDNGKFAKDAAWTYAKNNAGGDDAVLKIAEDIIDICANIKVDDNPCEATMQYVKCFTEQVNARKIH